jgi:hypothetical protein
MFLHRKASRIDLPGIDLGQELWVRYQFADRSVERAGDLLYHGIRLGMDSSAIQRILAVADT